MGPQHTTSYLLQHVCYILSKQADQVLQEQLGIGISQFKILRVLQFSPLTRQRQIADWLGQTEASISRQIKLMIDKGLLEVTISPKNRREHLTTPTAKGLRITEEALKLLDRDQAQMYKDVGDKKLLQLVDTLKQMHEHICPSGALASCHGVFQMEKTGNDNKIMQKKGRMS